MHSPPIIFPHKWELTVPVILEVPGVGDGSDGGGSCGSGEEVFHLR